MQGNGAKRSGGDRVARGDGQTPSVGRFEPDQVARAAQSGAWFVWRVAYGPRGGGSTEPSPTRDRRATCANPASCDADPSESP